jgi:hypothetical protein
MTNKEREAIAANIAAGYKTKKVLKKQIAGDSLAPIYDDVPVKKVTVAMPYGQVFLDMDDEATENLKELALEKNWSLHEFDVEEEKSKK